MFENNSDNFSFVLLEVIKVREIKSLLKVK